MIITLLIGGIAGTALIVFVLLALVVTIPIGLWLAVRWAFIPHSRMIDDRCGWDATRASADAVRGTWWRTAVFAVCSTSSPTAWAR